MHICTINTNNIYVPCKKYINVKLNIKKKNEYNNVHKYVICMMF